LDVKVVVAGTRVGQSEATLLNLLNISPFMYGMMVVQIFNQRNMFSLGVLDIDKKELIESGIKTITAILLALHYLTLVSVTHLLVNSYKHLLVIVLATDYTFEGAEKVNLCQGSDQRCVYMHVNPTSHAAADAYVLAGSVYILALLHYLKTIQFPLCPQFLCNSLANSLC
jgi:hypothetical protein